MIIQALSVTLEVLIVILALIVGIKKKKYYLCGLALTFVIYVFDDATRYFGKNIPETVLPVLFLVAAISAFWTILGIYRNKS